MTLSDFKITAAVIALTLTGSSPDEYKMDDEQVDQYNKIIFYANDRYNEIINEHLKAKHHVIIITPSREDYLDRKHILFSTPRPLFIHLNFKDIAGDLKAMDNCNPEHSLVVIEPKALSQDGIYDYVKYFQDKGFEILHDVPPSAARYSTDIKERRPLGLADDITWHVRLGYWRINKDNKLGFVDYNIPNY